MSKFSVGDRVKIVQIIDECTLPQGYCTESELIGLKATVKFP